MEDVAKVADRIIVMNKATCILDGNPKEIFQKIDKLEEVGLAAPQITYLVQELRNKGIEIEKEIFTVDQAKEAILKYLDNTKKANL